MDTFWPALLGALVPVLLAGAALLMRFGKVEREVRTLSGQVGTLDGEVRGMRKDLHGTEVEIVDRISRVEGLIEAQRRSAS